MATKQELEDEINERLQLDMEWSQMKKEDLIRFRDGLDDEDFVKKFVAQMANQKAGGMAQEQVMNWQPGQFAQLFAQMQEGEANPMDFFM